MERVRLLQEAWQVVLSEYDWKSFLTLTFRDAISKETGFKKWRSMVQALNRELYGNHYTRIVGHSYFTYVLATEFQARGVLHFHALVDRPINYQKVHSFWDHIAGFAYIKQVKEKGRVIEYVTKYVTKGGDLEFRPNKRFREPVFEPHWYNPARFRAILSGKVPDEQENSNEKGGGPAVWENKL